MQDARNGVRHGTKGPSPGRSVETGVSPSLHGREGPDNSFRSDRRLIIESEQAEGVRVAGWRMDRSIRVRGDPSVKSSVAVEKGTRKDAAISFLSLGSAGRVGEAYDRYVGANFRHHNAYFRGDAGSLAEGMAQNAANFPNKEFEVLHAIEEGN